MSEPIYDERFDRWHCTRCYRTVWFGGWFHRSAHSEPTGLCADCKAGDHSSHQTRLGGICIGCRCNYIPPAPAADEHRDEPPRVDDSIAMRALAEIRAAAARLAWLEGERERLIARYPKEMRWLGDEIKELEQKLQQSEAENARLRARLAEADKWEEKMALACPDGFDLEEHDQRGCLLVAMEEFAEERAQLYAAGKTPEELLDEVKELQRHNKRLQAPPALKWEHKVALGKLREPLCGVAVEHERELLRQWAATEITRLADEVLRLKSDIQQRADYDKEELALRQRLFEAEALLREVARHTCFWMELNDDHGAKQKQRCPKGHPTICAACLAHYYIEDRKDGGG